MVAEEREDAGRPGGFDPRYDPAFQRGYQPRPGERTQTRLRSDAPDSAYRRPSSNAPTRQDGQARQDEGTPLPDPVAPEAAPFAVDGGRVPPADDVELWTARPDVSPTGLRLPADLSPRRNPFMLALWLVGAGFVVLGIVLYCVSVTSSYNGPTPSTDVTALVFAQLGWTLAGPLITVGLLTLVALLFLTAVTARRPPATPSSDE
jgi:hypothetical protein